MLAVTPLLFPGKMAFAGSSWLHVHQHFLSPKSTGCCGLQERLSQTMDVALIWRHKPSPSREKAQPCLSHEWHRLVLCVMAFRNTHVEQPETSSGEGNLWNHHRDRECLGTRNLKAIIYTPASGGRFPSSNTIPGTLGNPCLCGVTIQNTQGKTTKHTKHEKNTTLSTHSPCFLLVQEEMLVF